MKTLPHKLSKDDFIDTVKDKLHLNVDGSGGKDKEANHGCLKNNLKNILLKFKKQKC